MGSCVGGSGCSSLTEEHNESLHDSNKSNYFVVVLIAVAFFFDIVYLFLLFEH